MQIEGVILLSQTKWRKISNKRRSPINTGGICSSSSSSCCCVVVVVLVAVVVVVVVMRYLSFVDIMGYLAKSN